MPKTRRGKAPRSPTGLFGDVSDDRDRTAIGAVDLLPLSIVGQMDRGVIQRVTREHRREIRACYESQLRRNNSLEGRVSSRS